MASGFSITDTDKGWSAIMKSLAGSGADKIAAYVGPDPHDIIAGDPQTGKKTPRVAEVKRDYYPLYVEYGTSRMAARPFIRFTLDAHDNYMPQLRAMAGRVLDRSRDGDTFLSMAASLRSLADSVAKDIQRTIQGLGAIDTARMYHSVKCLRVVVDDGGPSAAGAVATSWGSR